MRMREIAKYKAVKTSQHTKRMASESSSTEVAIPETNKRLDSKEDGKF